MAEIEKVKKRRELRALEKAQHEEEMALLARERARAEADDFEKKEEEDLKHEENSEKAVQCLNDMVTNALLHVEDCIRYTSALRDPAIFRFCAIPQIMEIGTLALCYNNIQVYKGVVKMRWGLTARVIDHTNTMADVYGAFFDFLSMLKAKIDKNDPNATITLTRTEEIQKICRDSETLSKRRLYVVRSEPRHRPIMMIIIFVILAVPLARLSTDRPYN